LPTSTPAETSPGLVSGGKEPRSAPNRAPDFRLRGDVVGRYVVIDKIGSGGMGIVYAAYDPELDRKIALKLLRPGASRGRAEVARARLLREAQALARLNHPGVIAVHDVGTFEDQVFIAMEFVDGIDAAQWARAALRTWREILPIWRQAGEGIAAAHAAGVVHRDLKPENVLIGNDERVRVLDFGLARTEAPDPTIDRSHDGEAVIGSSSIGPTSVRLTQAGAVMGTPAYMAPEQHTGGTLDARTDQFSFCVALYEALYGERPFAGESAPEIAFNVVRGRVREPTRDGPAIPAWLRKVILRGLSIAPDERWPDMRALLAALAADPAARQRRWALAGLAVSALAAAGLLLSTLRPDEEVCRGAERKLDGIWDTDVREQISAAFSRSSRPYASDALTSTAQMLDSHTATFVRLHQDACEATAIRKEQSQEMLDRQVACLERRLKDVRALTRLLASADDNTVTLAVTATAALPSFEPCADRQALMSSPGDPPTGELAERLAEVHDQLAAARQQVRLALYERALDNAKGALALAREAEHLATIAESLVVLGTAQVHMGDRTVAERTFRDAAWSADEAGDDITRAEASGHLVWVLSAAPERARELAELAEGATRILRRAGGDALIEATLHNNLGVAARRRGDAAQAVAEHERALALRRAHVAADDPVIADSLLNLGSSLADADSFDAAEKALAEAEQIVRTRYGDRHPRVATALHTHGIVSYRRGDYGSAADLLAAATEIRAAALPKGNPDLAGSRHDLGEALIAAGRLEAALEQFTIAATMREAANESKATIANSLGGRGRAELELGRADAARSSLARAVELMKDATDPIARAELELAYAKALVETDRDRARTLARGARDAHVAAASSDKCTGRCVAHHAAKRDAIDLWLAKAAAPP
jgi:serine/threonine protein kinase/tetratricopeptide (TPR) repeat protein